MCTVVAAPTGAGKPAGKGPDVAQQLEATQQIMQQREKDLQLSIELGQSLLERLQQAGEHNMNLDEQLRLTQEELQRTKSDLEQVLAESARVQEVRSLFWFVLQ